MGSPHDSLFKFVFGQPRYAARYFERVLPPEVAEVLAFERATLVPGSFVDEALRDRHTDLVFAVPQRDAAGDNDNDNDPAAFVFVLFEHQSRPEPMMAHRLHRYLGRLWDQWLAAHPQAAALPVVVPLVLYHGERPWDAPEELHKLVAWPAGLEGVLGPGVPDFRYHLMDLRVHAEEGLGDDAAGLTLRLMKIARARDFWARFERVAVGFRTLVVAPADLPTLRAFVQYLYEVRDALDSERFVRVITAAAGPEAGAVAMTAAEKFRQEGRRAAEIQLLSRMLALRFGALTTADRARLEDSTEDERSAWSERLLTATDLAGVFGTGRAPASR